MLMEITLRAVRTTKAFTNICNVREPKRNQISPNSHCYTVFDDLWCTNTNGSPDLRQGLGNFLEDAKEIIVIINAHRTGSLLVALLLAGAL